ncbi:hypothetical protein CBS63078_10374 [Aspergillus niger]|nr:hypothetical protein CBS63078_10374 [Aspergillus niger]
MGQMKYPGDTHVNHLLNLSVSFPPDSSFFQLPLSYLHTCSSLLFISSELLSISRHSVVFLEHQTVP